MLEVLRSGRLSLGPAIDRFERVFAEKVGFAVAAAVSSGTSGLHLLAAIAGLGEGDEVVANRAVLVRRLRQLLHLRGCDAGLRGRRRADDEPRPGRRRGCDHAADEGHRRGRHLRLPVCSSIRSASQHEHHGLVLIQDACEALGAEYKGRTVGSHGIDAVFAFYPNKQMTTGEGGIVTTHDEETWRSLVSLRNQGRADGGGWLDHARLGFNYRIDDIRAALGIGQVEKLDTILSLRQAAAARYGELLQASAGSRFRSPTTPTTSARGSSTSSRSRAASTASV